MTIATPCRTLVVEDEPLARAGLADWVRDHPDLALAGVCDDGPGALAAIRALRPALVFMDIQMPGLTGLQVLRSLADDPSAPRPAVVFTTAYDAHAVEAFELHAVDYLLKPFPRERFDEAVRHAIGTTGFADRSLGALATAAPANAAEPLARVLVRDSGRILPIPVDAIESLRSDTKYTAIASGGRHFLIRLPLAAFERRLDPKRFLKVNRSCIVNLDFVVEMVPDDASQLSIRLCDGSVVTANREVSRQLKADSL